MLPSPRQQTNIMVSCETDSCTNVEFALIVTSQNKKKKPMDYYCPIGKKFCFRRNNYIHHNEKVNIKSEKQDNCTQTDYEILMLYLHL